MYLKLLTNIQFDIKYCSLFLLVATSAFFLVLQPVKADTLGSITRYSIPTSSSKPYDITEGPDGNIWYTSETKNKIGKMTKAGSFTEYTTSSGNISHITTGPDSAMWFTMYSSLFPRVGRITSSGSISYFTMPTVGGQVGQPTNIVTGPDGKLWITIGNHGNIIRMTTSGVKETIDINGTPLAIFSDPENQNIWFASRDGTNDGYIGKIDMDGQVTHHTIPYSGNGALYSISMGPDGNVWFSTGSSKIGKMTTGGSYTIYTPAVYSSVWRVTPGLDGNIWATTYLGNKIVKVTTGGTMTIYNTTYGAEPLGLTPGSDGNMWFTEYGANKISKIGTGISGSSTDSDGDGITASQELQQSTSDNMEDTDGDGLNDNVESQWFADSVETFCDTGVTNCAFPSPLQKDVYVEIDWMVDPSDSTSYKPSPTHVSSMKAPFTDKGVNLHVDTGDYGGGNEIDFASNLYFEPSTSNLDFYDYKSGNPSLSMAEQFDNTYRYGVWHYGLIVKKAENNTAIGGVAYPGDDDFLIAYQSLLDRGSNFVERFPRTIIHELGHNLCLTSDSVSPNYTGQDSKCAFEGVDAVHSTDYASAMNYDMQFTMDYSAGGNGSSDHNDWSGVMVGIDDFTRQAGGDGVAHSMYKGKKVKKDPGKIKDGSKFRKAIAH